MAEVRFATGWRRFFPVVGYHHVLMILIAIAIILLCKSTQVFDHRYDLLVWSNWLTHISAPALLLAGCSSASPLIPDIFLISLYYQQYPAVFSPSQVDPGVTTAIANIVGNANLLVRVGYFGICIQYSGSAFMCNDNATALA